MEGKSVPLSQGFGSSHDFVKPFYQDLSTYGKGRESTLHIDSKLTRFWKGFISKN